MGGTPQGMTGLGTQGDSHNLVAWLGCGHKGTSQGLVEGDAAGDGHEDVCHTMAGWGHKGPSQGMRRVGTSQGMDKLGAQGGTLRDGQVRNTQRDV